jgi:hypothetical protein
MGSGSWAAVKATEVHAASPGGTTIVAGATVFAELAEQLGAGDVMGQADLALSNALASSMSRPALKVFAALPHLGDTAFLSLLCAAVAMALLALGRRQLAVGWLVAVTGSGLWHARLRVASTVAGALALANSARRGSSRFYGRGQSRLPGGALCE